MHFIGMFSFSLNIPIRYDFALTGYSLIIAVFVSWFALHVVTRKHLGVFRLLVGGQRLIDVARDTLLLIIFRAIR